MPITIDFDHGDNNDNCDVAAWGVMRAPLDEVPALRKVPGPLVGSRLPPSLLKHADEHTVLGLGAVLRAIHDGGWRDRDLSGWGVIAAPRFPGRVSLAGSLEKFVRRGAASVSPLIIPNLSLHAMAGSISLALKMRGFNFGVGGGHDHLAEALMTGLAARGDGGVPGVWVVASEWDPEPVPDGLGGSHCSTVGTAVALALVAEEAGIARLGLRLISAGPISGEAPASSRLAELADFLLSRSSPTGSTRPWRCPLRGCGTVELEDRFQVGGMVASRARA